MSDRRQRIRDKIMARVFDMPPPADTKLTTPCKIWKGPTSGSDGRGAGYPRMNLDGATVAVHKANWTNEHGLIPPKKQLDHICRRRLCIADDHLEMVTHKTNQKRRDDARRIPIECGVVTGVAAYV